MLRYRITLSDGQKISTFTSFGSEEAFNAIKNLIEYKTKDSQADKEFLLAYFSYIYKNKSKPFDENEIKD
jgi:hypothetical protein